MKLASRVKLSPRSCLPGEGRGRCVIIPGTFLRWLFRRVCARLPHTTLHGEPDSGQGWLESCFTPRPLAALVCGLWPESSVAPEKGRCWLELMLAS